jgi:hypothetical protein
MLFNVIFTATAVEEQLKLPTAVSSVSPSTVPITQAPVSTIVLENLSINHYNMRYFNYDQC